MSCSWLYNCFVRAFFDVIAEVATFVKSQGVCEGNAIWIEG